MKVVDVGDQAPGMLFTLPVTVNGETRAEAQLIIAASPAGTPEELRAALHKFVDAVIDEMIAYRIRRVAQA